MDLNDKALLVELGLGTWEAASPPRQLLDVCVELESFGTSAYVVLFVCLINHNRKKIERKYCWLICYEREILLIDR